MTRVVVAYGTERPSPRLAEATEAAGALPSGVSAEVGRPGAPVAALDLAGSSPLRLSDLRHPFALAPVAQDLTHADTQLAFLARHLAKLCGLWAKPQVAFVQAYFDALRTHVRTHEAALTDRVGALAGLVEPQHWCFAAPMPLPRAHLAVGSEMVRVDFLFRDSRGLMALSVSRNTPSTRQLRDFDAMEAAGVRVLMGLPPVDGQALLDHLGRDFADFTRGVDLPKSPFHGTGVPDLVRS